MKMTILIVEIKTDISYDQEKLHMCLDITVPT